MKKILLLSFCLCLSWSAFSQFGFTIRYQSNEAPDFQVVQDGSEIELLDPGLSYGVDYWFRLKNYRVEFLPELNFASYSSDNLVNYDLNYNQFSFFFNTNLYLLDFEGDCDCPTFSKDGPTLAKGFFVQISPGVSYFQQETTIPGEEPLSANTLAFSIGGGIGFDIGVSDFITISPMGGLRYFPEVVWESPSLLTGGGTETSLKSDRSSLSQFFAGLRVGIRLDE